MAGATVPGGQLRSVLGGETKSYRMAMILFLIDASRGTDLQTILWPSVAPHVRSEKFVERRVRVG